MENDLFKSSVISTQPKDGLHIKCISLDGNLVPSKFDDSKLTPSQAKQLIDKYAFSTKCHIDELREQNSAKVKKAQTLHESKQAVSAVGSEETIYSIGDCGLFATVLIAYNNHWRLRTSPEDWWFCVIKRVACAIDRNAKKESVRKMFVDHERKKTIEVVVPHTSIYNVDYS